MTGKVMVGTSELIVCLIRFDIHTFVSDMSIHF